MVVALVAFVVIYVSIQAADRAQWEAKAEVQRKLSEQAKLDKDIADEADREAFQEQVRKEKAQELYWQYNMTRPYRPVDTDLSKVPTSESTKDWSHCKKEQQDVDEWRQRHEQLSDGNWYLKQEYYPKESSPAPTPTPAPKERSPKSTPKTFYVDR
jgi:hypothetical protein